MNANADITSLLRRIALLTGNRDDGSLQFQPDETEISSLCAQVRTMIPAFDLTNEEIKVIALLHTGKQWYDVVQPIRSHVPRILTSLREKGIVEVESLPTDIIEETLLPPVAFLSHAFLRSFDTEHDQIKPFESCREYLLSWFNHVKRLHRYRENERDQHPVHGLVSERSKRSDSSPTETERKFAQEEKKLITRSQIGWEGFSIERVVHQLRLDRNERLILLFVLMCELNNDRCSIDDLLTLVSKDVLDSIGIERYWKPTSMLRLYDLISIEDSRQIQRLRTQVSMRGSVKRWLASGEGQVFGITDVDDSEPYASEYEHIEDWIRFGRMWVRLSRLVNADKLKGLDDEVPDVEIEPHCRPASHPLLTSMKERIERKSKASPKKFPLDVLTERHELCGSEKDVLVLLLESVTCGRDIDLDDLTLFMTPDPSERQKVAELLTPDSKLVVNGLVTTTQRRNGSVELTLPTRIRNYLLGVSESFETTAKDIVMNDDLLSLATTDKTLDDLILPNEIMEAVRKVVRSYELNADAVLRSWGILPSRKDKKNASGRGSLTCLLSGPPGTGKTLLAHCLAGSLGKDLLVTDCSRLLSVWVSESEKSVSRLFSTYASIVRNSDNFPCLLLNEVDQFWTRRGTSAERSVDRMYHQMQNLFLEKLESFEGILLCTTNLVESLDPAFSRRMLIKLTIPMPSAVARLAIWKLHLKAPVPIADDVDLERLADDFEFSGGSIRNCVVIATTNAAVRGDIVRMDDLVGACRAEESGAFDSTSTSRKRQVGFCAPESELRMKEPVHSER